MAHKTISDDELLARALELFRASGFDGVTLKQLADAMGLEKASMYYRFPGGKDEIALAVVQAVETSMREQLFKPLYVSGVSPRRRVKDACELAREMYAGGRKSCALDVLSIEGTTEGIKKTLQSILEAWIGAFSAVAKDAGLTTSQARQRAEEAVIQLEGALVVSRVSKDPDFFDRTLKRMPDFLTRS